MSDDRAMTAEEVLRLLNDTAGFVRAFQKCTLSTRISENNGAVDVLLCEVSREGMEFDRSLHRGTGKTLATAVLNLAREVRAKYVNELKASELFIARLNEHDWSTGDE